MPDRNQTETFVRLANSLVGLGFWLIVVIVFAFIAWAIWGWVALAVTAASLLILWNIAGNAKSPPPPQG